MTTDSYVQGDPKSKPQTFVYMVANFLQIHSVENLYESGY